MVFLSPWYVKMAFGASLIIPLCDQNPNGAFGVNPEVILGFIVYVMLAVFKFY
jgi:hypothetical protein